MRKTPRALLAALLMALAPACDRVRDDAEADSAATAAADTAVLDPALAAVLPQGVDEATARRGRALYETCGVCHGMAGEGTALGPSLVDREWIHGTGEMASISRVIRAGVSDPREAEIPMPPLGGGDFDATDVEAIAAYVYALSRSNAPAADTASPAAPSATERSDAAASDSLRAR